MSESIEGMVSWATDNGSGSSTGVAGYRRVMDRFNVSRKMAEDVSEQARRQGGFMDDSIDLTDSIIEAAKWSVSNPTEYNNWAGAERIKDNFPNLSRSQCRKAAEVARNLIDAANEARVERNNTVNLEDFETRRAIIDELKKTGLTIYELSEYLGCSEDRSKDILRSLKDSGWEVINREGKFRLEKLAPNTVPSIHDTSRTYSGTHFEVGIISDTHIASKYTRWDIINCAYDEFERRGISTVFHAGNLLDGFSERINASEVLFRNVTDQAHYCVQNYPYKEGMKTHFLTELCHSGWAQKLVGLNVGEYIQLVSEGEGRDDLIHAGCIEADFKYCTKDEAGHSILRMVHPGGGSSYADSYQAQKIVESYTGGEKPDILVVGHFHKAGTFKPRGVHVVLAGACQSQSAWMRSRRISSHVGFSILNFSLDAKGAIAKFGYEFFPFYDTNYHIDAGEWELGVLDSEVYL